MIINQWKKVNKARKAIVKRAQVWNHLESVSQIMDRLHPKSVVHHVGRCY